ncbi:MAG: HAD family phosphatase [Bryobacteraceae bacterium]
MKYDGFLFDFDGVIADTEPIHWNSWRFALAPHGLDLSWDDYCRVCRGLAPSAMRPALRTVVPDVDRVPDLEDRYHQAKDEAFAHLADNPPITPETIAMLHGLRTVIRAGLVTSAMRITVEPVLHKSGIHSVFDAFIYREDVTHPKPAPDAYRIGAERLGGKRILVFEDTPAGLESARAAGLDVVLVDDCARLPELVRCAVTEPRQ